MFGRKFTETKFGRTLILGGLAFFLVGYAFAFGEGNAFIGHSNFASVGMAHSEFTSVFFQVSF